MNLNSIASTLAKSNPLNTFDLPLQTTYKGYSRPGLSAGENPFVFPPFQTQMPFLQDVPSRQIQVIDEDADLIMYEPCKKTKFEKQTATMATTSNGLISPLPTDIGFKKNSEKPTNRSLNPSNQLEKGYLEDQKSSKDTSESLSTYNSNFSFGDQLFKREVIDLEDDQPVKTEKDQGTKEKELDSLVVADDVMINLNRTKDNFLRQMLLKNLINQTDLPLPRQSNDPYQTALLAQMMQANPLSQFNQRGFMNQLGNVPFYNSNSAMMSPLYYNLQLNSLVRQANFPLFPNEFADSSILGKRPEPHNGFENLPTKGSTTNKPLPETEIIVLDDDEPNQNCSQNDSLFTALKERRKVFTIEKTTRKPVVTKKAIFKIIRQQKTSYSYKIGKTFGMKWKSTILSTYKRKVENQRDTSESDSDEGQERDAENQFKRSEVPAGVRRSIRLRGEKIPDIDGMNHAALRAKEINQNEENYVIKLHITDDEDLKNISQTPIGDRFQVNLVPFSIDMDAKRPVKCVWDPDSIDEEFVKECCKKIENKFNKTIVGEETILRALKKHDFNVETIIEEIETNKMIYKSFFEVRKKVLRSRILSYHY